MPNFPRMSMVHVSIQVVVVDVLNPPIISAGYPQASELSVTTTSTQLSVIATDADNAESELTYTCLPATQVSPNASNIATNPVATFQCRSLYF